jgi:hypothetical protein
LSRPEEDQAFANRPAANRGESRWNNGSAAAVVVPVHAATRKPLRILVELLPRLLRLEIVRLSVKYRRQRVSLIHRVPVDRIPCRAVKMGGWPVCLTVLMGAWLVWRAPVPAHSTPHPTTSHQQENTEREQYPVPVLR